MYYAFLGACLAAAWGSNSCIHSGSRRIILQRVVFVASTGNIRELQGLVERRRYRFARVGVLPNPPPHQLGMS